MKKKNRIKIEEHFIKLNETILSWLSFGEAKNGALVVFNTALFAALITLKEINPKIILTILICLIISTLVALATFFPSLISYLHIRRRNKKDLDLTNINLMYFNDIAKLDKVNDFVKLTIAKYFPKINLEEEPLESETKILDLASEALINSKISSRKYLGFRVSLIINCLILFAILIFIILNLSGVNLK